MDKEEAEWRLAGDLCLSEIPQHLGYVLVPSLVDAAAIAGLCHLPPVIWEDALNDPQ